MKRKLPYILKILVLTVFIASVVSTLYFVWRSYNFDKVILTEVDRVSAFESSLSDLNELDSTFIRLRDYKVASFKMLLIGLGASFLLFLIAAIRRRKRKNLLWIGLIFIVSLVTSTAYFSLKPVYVPKPFNDVNGVQIFYYGDRTHGHIGYQRNPLFICTQGLDYYEEYKEGNDSSLVKFRNVITWLEGARVVKEDASYLYCEFDFLPRNMKAPWGSALYNSRAVLLYLAAHEYYQDSSYLEVARSFIVPYSIEIPDGGFLYKISEDQWWYCEYPQQDGQPELVLNGMISVITSLDSYFGYTNDSTVIPLLDKGMNALKQNIQVYDNEGYSFYNSLKEPAGERYHLMHISQLGQLYEISKDSIFLEYQQKWAAYAEGQGWHW